MMNPQPPGSLLHDDDFGQRVAARLNGGTSEMPHHVTERLRAARAQAVARRKRTESPPARPRPSFDGIVAGDRPGWWARLATTVPVVALAAGLVAIHLVHNEMRAAEVAEVDAALLTDALPPSAYTDAGFIEFLKAAAP